MKRWKSRSDVERQFSPTHWGYSAGHPDRAYMAECPTLMQYDALYGEGASAYWVETQVTALFGASPTRETGLADGIRTFSAAFAAEVRTFKLSELMLFFARYKAGRYDNSYSAFDSRRIGNAFFHEFVKERNIELDRITKERQSEEIEARRFIPPKGYTSHSWYMELKRRAEAGDEEAKRLLTPPNDMNKFSK